MVNEQRCQSRYDLADQVHVDILYASNEEITEKIRYEGTIKDVSSNGIRLHGKHRLEKDATLDLSVELEKDHSVFNLSGMIKWVTSTTENEYIAGLKLVNNADISRWQGHFSS